MALGHPKGLFPLFFTEMWERLAFYTMLGILLLYSTDVERGGLGLPAAEGNEIYGLYLAFVYFTPFLGGMIADRFIGYRKAVFIGGILMASGLFMMSIQGKMTFIGGLVCLVLGNGFFKPNISVMVGNLYQPGDPKRDAGFNIFYMGINIGALIATFLAASVRNNLGWLWTFRVAGFGLVISLIILVMTWKVLARADRRPEKSEDDTKFSTVLGVILAPAMIFGVIGYFAAIWLESRGVTIGMRPAVFGFLIGALPIIGYFIRLGLKASQEERPGLLALLPIYVAGGTFFMVLHLNGSAMTQWARDNTDRQGSWVPSLWKQEALPRYYLNANEDVPRPNKQSLLVTEDAGIARMYGQQRMDERSLSAIEQMEGIEIREIPPENQGIDEQWIARATNVYEDGVVTVREGVDSHGHPMVTVELPDGAQAKRRVAFLRLVGDQQIATYIVERNTFEQLYQGYEQRFGHPPEELPPGQYLHVVNSEVYQMFNPLCVIIFTPLIVWFFAFLVARNKGLSTARKIFLGLALTTVSLLLMALAGLLSDNGDLKVTSLYLVGFYVVVTLGELCLSPMGLSLVTKLSPKRLVGLTMGGWFLATAFGNNFSGFFGGIQGSMTPVNFFLLLAGLAAVAAGFIFMLLPKIDAAINMYDK